MSGSGDTDYWSIGDVLALLHDDFPDVTISKIRFLESQGLIRPERTPSGYRRFKEQDLDRLRWVLVQQRDNYLPLKVIRDRLDEIGDGPLPDIDPEPRPEQLQIGATSSVVAQAGISASSANSLTLEASVDEIAIEIVPELEADPAHNETPAETEPLAETPAEPEPLDEAPAETEPAPEAAIEPTPEPVAPSSLEADPTPAPSKTGNGATPANNGNAHAVQPNDEPTADSSADDGGTADSTTDDGGTADSSADDGGTADSTAEQSTAAENEADAESPPTAVGGASTDPTGESFAPEIDETGPESGFEIGSGEKFQDFGPDVALTREELAEASGCSEELIEQLERYGLVVGRSMAATILYDSSALAVARMSAQFSHYGLDPRHLRLFERGAESEIELFAQVVTPMIRRGDAETVRRAGNTLNDLVELAASLRAVLVRQQIRDQMPPGF